MATNVNNLGDLTGSPAKTLADLATALAAIESAIDDLAGGGVVSGTVAVSNFPSFPADQLVHATNLDIALTVLRDAIVKTGGTSKTLADLWTLLNGGLPAALGQGTMAQSLRVVVASDQTGVAVDTELPAAAALADGATNPTTPLIGDCLHGFNGTTWDRIHVPNQSADLSAVSITSIATVATPDSGKKLRLTGGMISVSAACSVLFEDNSGGGGTVFRTPKLLADTPYNFVVRGGQGYKLGTNNNVLKATASAAASITGTLDYSSE